jgi:hypothetical protein
MIKTSIIDPNAKLTKGFPANVMPSNYESLIDPTELKELVDFLVESTSKGGGGK